MTKVVTYGTYDLFHQGHYNLLKRAKELGDYLVVGITSDYFNKCRGKFNVHDDLMTRIKNVEKSGFADEIVVEEYFGQKIDDIKKYGIDIFTVGDDWVGHFDYLNEYCKVVYLPRTQGVSSTQLRNRNSIRLGVVGDEIILDRVLDEKKFVSGLEVTGIFIPESEVTFVEYKAKKASHLLQYERLEAMLDDVDAVYLNSPLRQRSFYMKKAIAADKHILTEFPFSDNLEEAEEILALAKQHKVLVMEALKTAYCPCFSKLVSLAKSGLIGEILSVDARFTQVLGKDVENQIRIAGGAVQSLAAYPLLAIFKLLGTDYKQVSFFSHEEEGTDILTRINFVFEKAVASAMVAINAKAEGNMVIAGTKGYIYVPAPWWKTEFFEVCYEDINKNNKYFYKFEGEGLRYELVEFVRSIHEHSTDNLLFTSEEMLAECKVLDLFMKRESTKFF